MCGLHLILFFFLKDFLKIIYLFLAVLGLRFCARAFSSCGKRGPLFTHLILYLVIQQILVEWVPCARYYNRLQVYNGHFLDHVLPYLRI